MLGFLIPAEVSSSFKARSSEGWSVVGPRTTVRKQTHRALDLEERCYGLLARNQPMASDLRRIVTDPTTAPDLTAPT